MNSTATLIEVSSPASGASPADLVDRLPPLMGAPPDAAMRFDSARVLLVGSGSIGLAFALPLARLRVGELAIVDPKEFKAESVLTHDIPPEAVGQSKAFFAADLAKRISPRTRVLAAQAGFESLNLSELASYNVVFLATDNLLAELKVSQACVALGIPVIQGSVLGEALCGHVRFLANNDSKSPCITCAYTRDEWTQLNRNTVFSCEGGSAKLAANEPTRSLNSLCSLIAQLGVLQFTRDLLGLGAPVRNTTLEYCAYTHATSISKLIRNPNCPCEHHVLRRVTPPRPLAQCSPREVMNAAELEGEVTLEVDGHVWADTARCQCGSWSPCNQFVRSDVSTADKCPDCGAHAVPHPFQSHRRAPLALLKSCMDHPLNVLNVTNARWAAVRSSEGGAILLDAYS